MSAPFLSVFLALGLGQTKTADARPPNPLAPSLPQLTAKEVENYEAVVDRFIQFETGKIAGAAGKKAAEDFNRLPPEAIFVLIDGFNRAASLEASCAVVVIGKKITRILNASEDLELFAFAKENLGAGVTAKRHLGMLKDVQFSILLRKGAVQRKLAATGNFKATAKQVNRQMEAQLKRLLKHERPEVRAATAKEIGKRGLPLGNELVDLLQDSEPAVQQAARQGLRQLSRGQDFGPAPEASFTDREEAARRWRAWWMSNRP